MKKDTVMALENLKPYKGKFFNATWPTFPQMFAISVDRFGGRICFTDFDGPNQSRQSYTYNQVFENVKNIAMWLKNNGIEKGDHIAVTGKNSPEWATAYIATLFAGATVVPLDNGLHENEVENLIKTAKPKIVFSDDDKWNFLSEKADELNYMLCSVSRKHNENFVYDLKGGNMTLLEIMDAAKSDDVAAILFTSGTTGNPKGVMLTHENLISDCYIAQTHIDLFETDVFYALLPIHHAYTMQAAFICPLSAGCEIVFGKSMAVTRLMHELKEGKITLMLGVPLLYNKILAGIMKGVKAKGPAVEGLIGVLRGISYFVKKVFKVNIGKKLFASVLKQANLSTMRVMICGGGPLSSNVFKVFNEMGIDFIQGYGLTETSPIIALNPIAHFKIESVGSEFTGFAEFKIIDADENGVGEIAIKGPMVMKGYYNMPEETAKVFTEDGFFKTGDLGYLDSERYLMLCGRAKNLIVTAGGKNVYPEEIEDAFQMCENVNQIVVRAYKEASVGTLNEDNGEEIEAVIYPSDVLFENLNLKRETDTESEAIRSEIKKDVDAVNKTLQPYARIKKITILKEPMAMTTTMKVKR